MTAPDVNLGELRELIAAVREEQCTMSQAARLSVYLTESPLANEIYAKYSIMQAMLELDFNNKYSLPIDVPHSVSPTLTVFGNVLHNVANNLSSDWLVSYLVAAVIFSVGALITSHIYIFSPEQIADNSPLTAPASVPAVVQPERKLVGQVTGLVDCHWSDSHRAAYLGRRIAVGDEFALASGLAEITYDTGAKVLLQGPVTYQVDSSRSGLLSVGKLTARVKKKETGDQNSHPQSSPLFAVCTPCAVVTDLGTEFGVEVDSKSVTKCEVFVGAVEVKSTAANGKQTSQPVRLHKGEAVQIVASANSDSNCFTRLGVGSTQFIRAIDNIKRPRVLISTIDKQQPSWWRFTQQKPKADWTQLSFDDSYWEFKKASFGGGCYRSLKTERQHLTQPPVVTGWFSPDIWLRQEVEVKNPNIFEKAVLTIFHDADAEVYVNGIAIFKATGSRTTYGAFDVTKKLRTAIREGVNIVAAHVHQAKGHQFFDLGLTLDPWDETVPQVALTPESVCGNEIVLIPSADKEQATWRWTTELSFGHWKSFDFDDRDWAEGKAGFGPIKSSALAPVAKIGTNWNTDDIWLRKVVTLSNVPAEYIAVLRVFHDEDVEIFVNGELVFSESGFLIAAKTVDITQHLQGVLRPGKNIVAVHVHQTIGWQYIDMGLSLYVK
jgi:hypothetical protein